MKNLIFLAAILICRIAYSQGFVTENKTWHVRDHSWWDVNTEIFKIQGDTVINELTYKKLWSSWNDSAQVDMYLRGFLREDSGIVYYRDNYLTEDKILYNFNLEQGDTATVYSEFCQERTVVVAYVDSIYYYGIPRKELILDSWYEEYWIQGIGSTYGLLYSGVYECVADVSKSLICCHEDDSLIFMKQYEEECYQTNVGIDEDPIQRDLIMSPNPVLRGQPVVIQCNNGIEELELIDYSGRTIFSFKTDFQKEVTLQTNYIKAGLYLIRIYSDTGQNGCYKLVVR
jgi:hypothetical protein